MVQRNSVVHSVVAYVVGFVRSLGPRRLVLHSDNEPAILSLKREIRKQLDVEVVEHESPPYDHQGNGFVQVAVPCACTRSGVPFGCHSHGAPTHHVAAQCSTGTDAATMGSRQITVGHAVADGSQRFSLESTCSSSLPQQGATIWG